jgi:hypothetical protein
LGIGGAQITLDELAKPFSKLDVDRLVEPQTVAYVVKLLLRHSSVAGEERIRTTRHELGKEKRENCDPKEKRDRPQ